VLLFDRRKVFASIRIGRRHFLLSGA